MLAPVFDIKERLAAARLAAAKDHPRLGAYVILSLTTGIRTEEAQACGGITSIWTSIRTPGRRCR